jgi:polysaccharide biosynthesis protein PslH
VRSVVVTKFVPTPPNGGDKRRTLGLARALRQFGDVTVCGFSTPDEDADLMRSEGFQVSTVPLRRTVRSLAGGLRRGRTLTAARFWDHALAGLVGNASVGADLIVVEHVQLMPYLEMVKGTPVTVVDMHNIESSLTLRYARSQHGLRRLGLLIESRLIRSLERRAGRCDAVAVVSEVDRDILSAIAPELRPVILPNAWDAPSPLAPSAVPLVSFVAMLSWAPNVDAATWFVKSVWPLVLAGRPDAVLELVGRNPSSVVRSLSSASVTVTGTVPDLTPYYARCSVAVAPLRAGGGSRLKILEALSFARPVVSTTIGIEGLEDLVGRGVTVADHPHEMAAAILRLLADPQRAADNGALGAAAVAQDHSWESATRPLLEVLSNRLEIAR